jgi:hypothetical protein
LLLCLLTLFEVGKLVLYDVKGVRLRIGLVLVGKRVGLRLGFRLGFRVGFRLGFILGLNVVFAVGLMLGLKVGFAKMLNIFEQNNKIENFI